MSKTHISSLNGLRTISILMVITSHLYRHGLIGENIFIKYTKLWLFNGALGVNVFFIISGFLITTLLINEQQNFKSISLKNFYVRRTIRIFPAYYFLLLVYFILQLNGFIHLSSRNWLSNITYTKQFFPDTDNEAGHLWSLSVEEMFYLVWPMLFITFKKYLSTISWALVSLITIARIVQFQYPEPQFVNTIFSTGDALLIGCIIAMNYDKVAGTVIKCGNWNLLLFPALIMCVLIFSRLYYYSSVNTYKSLAGLNVLQAIAYGLVGNIGLITNLIIALILVYSINITSFWYKFLNLPFMEYIGKLSYSIYLWQQILTQNKVFFYKTPVVVLFLYIACAAVFSYYVIEKPFLRLKKRFDTFTPKVIKHHN